MDYPEHQGFNMEEGKGPKAISRDNPMQDSVDRYGAPGGNFVAGMENGEPASFESRALPNVENPDSYHSYDVDNGRYCDAIDVISSFESDPATSLDSINNIIDDINAERGTDIQYLDADELEALSDRYQQLQDTEFADVRDELGIENRDFTKYGVHGYAKSMEDASGDIICEGGADQFNTALPEYMLKRIGIEY